jgi:hypothetical protein
MQIGVNVRAGQPILMVEAAGKQRLSFNVRDDYLSGLTVGETVSVMWNGDDGAIKSAITELRPLGVFATRQAERVIGDHDRNTLRLRLDPQGEAQASSRVWLFGLSIDNLALTVRAITTHSTNLKTATRSRTINQCSGFYKSESL